MVKSRVRLENVDIYCGIKITILYAGKKVQFSIVSFVVLAHAVGSGQMCRFIYQLSYTAV